MATTREPPQHDVASVLVVDDTPANLVALGAVLRPLGVRVVEAHSGPEAIDCVAREPFAVVLLDVQMPGMDGLEVARRLRASKAGVEVPIIFLTAIHRDETYVRKGYAQGAADYITKPFDPDVLRARVKAFVDLFHQRERLRVKEVGERTRERDEALERLAALLASEREARKEAESANRAKDEFLATVSHELRTPLGAILGWASIAQRQPTSPEVARALTIIERNARAQMRIVEDVLDVGRAAGGHLRLELSPTRVEDAISEAMLAVRPAADAKGVRLEATVAGERGRHLRRPREAAADRVEPALECHQVHAERRARGGPRRPGRRPGCQSGSGTTARGFAGTCSLTCSKRSGRATGRAPAVKVGSGSAWRSSSSWWRLTAGRSAVESDGEGRGSTFMLTLPIARSVPAQRSAPAPRAPRSLLAESTDDARLEGVKVLVVDDDDDSRELIASVLADLGASVVGASSADEAVNRLEQSVPDVLLSDIAMPDVDGYALLRRIRGLPVERGGGVPAIALTAYARPVDGERAYAAGFPGPRDQADRPRPALRRRGRSGVWSPSSVSPRSGLHGEAADLEVRGVAIAARGAHHVHAQRPRRGTEGSVVLDEAAPGRAGRAVHHRLGRRRPDVLVQSVIANVADRIAGLTTMKQSRRS